MKCWDPFVVKNILSADAQVANMGPADAQRFCNFVVFEFGWLPDDCRMTRCQVRRECVLGRDPSMQAGRIPNAEANASSLRMEVEGNGRSFRMKQFLFDFAPPAADQPCLWQSETKAWPLDGTYVLWTGTDFKRHVGATARIMRTNCELSVTSGAFDSQALVEIYGGLQPSDPDRAELIWQVPFANLSYWGRYRPDVFDVPTGLWSFRRSDPKEPYYWTSDENARYSTPFALPVLALEMGFSFDSIGYYGAGHDDREAEVVYTAGQDRGREIRFIVSKDIDQSRIHIPPSLERDRHPCIVTRYEIGHLDLHVAYVSPEHGPFHAVWRDLKHGTRTLLLTSTATPHDKVWFDRLLRSVCYDR
jgi:hypothetical protein